MATIDKVKVWQEDLIIPTYKVYNPEKNPLFIEKRAYQGSTGKVYPPGCKAMEAFCRMWGDIDGFVTDLGNKQGRCGFECGGQRRHRNDVKRVKNE